MAEKDGALAAGKRNDITVVAEDKNWRDYVSKELKSADAWSKDWGFLAGGVIEGKYPLFSDFVTSRWFRTTNEVQGPTHCRARGADGKDEGQRLRYIIHQGWPRRHS